MDIIAIIVHVKEECCNSLLTIFADMPHIRVYGVRDNQTILVLDTDDVHVLAQSTSEIQKLNGVTGVYPVFSRDSLPF